MNKRKQTQTEKMDEYIAFTQKNGHQPNLQSLDEKEAMLGRVAQKWRQKYKLSTTQGVTNHPKLGPCIIPPAYVDALAAIGFRWKARDIKPKRTLGKTKDGKKKQVVFTWEERYEQLKAYKAKHGHCEPPKRHRKCGEFAYNMRRQYKFMKEGLRSSLTVDRYQKLSDLGFRFDVAGHGHSRTRYVDDVSSGYDSSDSDGDNNNKGSNNAGLLITQQELQQQIQQQQQQLQPQQQQQQPQIQTHHQLLQLQQEQLQLQHLQPQPLPLANSPAAIAIAAASNIKMMNNNNNGNGGNAAGPGDTFPYTTPV